MASPRKPPRWVQWTVVPLLVLVPIGYVIISAEQSRDGGEEKQKQAAATTITHYWPTRVQRRIYEIPIPGGSKQVGYLETNSWATSTLYVQFQTSAGGLDTFLAQVGTSREALEDGTVTVTAKQQRTVRWAFAAGDDWAGVKLTQHGDKPDHRITVDLKNPNYPMVYVVSTMNF
jgi:hypothetical protein